MPSDNLLYIYEILLKYLPDDEAMMAHNEILRLIMDDSKPIYSIKHPQLTPLWKRIIHFFVRPKFAESNLEFISKK